ncbi:hypothetical protein [Geobacter anodireducens]|uniref:Uncharacterized protein n=1 Tax=Geobacter anodireducens TaxID=1340425 RepID=A0ABR9NXJ3_9BACT|nr:hypothetical protein [Geobacter anodireducens]MBE2888963.1 hypothetical protein [Geobacter anodireducens]
MSAALWQAALSLAAYLLPLIVEGLKNWHERREGHDHDANIQDYRNALGKGAAAALSVHHADQHDRVLAALRGSGWRGTGDNKKK